MPNQETTTSLEGADLSQVGQVIDCCVVESDPVQEKLILSQKVDCSKLPFVV